MKVKVVRSTHKPSRDALPLFPTRRDAFPPVINVATSPLARFLITRLHHDRLG